MAPLRPEGLSPCFSSVMSPDIPESHYFRWTFRSSDPDDTQSKAEIRIYEDSGGSPSLIHTYVYIGSDQELEAGIVGYNFTPGNEYWWDIRTYDQSNEASPISVMAKFVYDYVPAATPILWTEFPQMNDVVNKGIAFDELRDNLSNLLSDYEDASNKLVSDVNNLFSGEVVPDRKDFNAIEKALTFIATNKEGISKLDVIELIEDALGTSDLSKIRDFIDLLATIPPQPVSEVRISIPNVSMYKPYNFTVSSSGVRDQTVNLSWDVEPIPKSNGTILLNSLSPSTDIRYYDCEFEYGSSSDPYVCRLFYRPEDFAQLGYSIVFDTDWTGLFTLSTISSAKHAFRMTGVDRRGNESTTYSVTKTYDSNFKVPFGLKNYEVQYQRASLSDDDGPDPSGKWVTFYTGKTPSTVHTITGGEGKYYYRVRAVDISGLYSDWVYNDGVLFDPLLPPGPVKNLRYTSTTTSVTLYWDPVPTAEEYEAKWINGSIFYRGTSTKTTRSDLSPDTKYTFCVRAVNRAGAGPWTNIVTKTKAPRKTTTWTTTRGKSWRTKYGGWRSDNDVIQGEWCEIAGSPHQSGPPGHCWGKHKGLWFFDSADIREKLAGKKIIKVRLYIRRKGSYHGYYHDQLPTYWLHNYSSVPKGEPKYVSGTKYKHPPKFRIGESGWVELPIKYGEYLRDNKAKGIMIWVDNWGKLPYLRFSDYAKLEITYE